MHINLLILQSQHIAILFIFTVVAILYLQHATPSMKKLITTKKFGRYDGTGIHPASVLVGDVWHIVGGNQSSIHTMVHIDFKGKLIGGFIRQKIFHELKWLKVASIYDDNYNIPYDIIQSMKAFVDHPEYDFIKTTRYPMHTEWFNKNMESRLIYAKHWNKLILLGGKDGFNYLKSIWLYSIKDKKWKISNICLPYPMAGFGSILWNKMLIIFGGFCVGKLSDEIHIVSLDGMINERREFKKLSGKCPKKDKYHAVITNNNNKEFVHLFGYNSYLTHYSIALQDLIDVIV
eukprot:232473_1